MNLASAGKRLETLPAPLAAVPGSARRTPPPAELRRRIVQLMLFRVALITLVLGTTVALHVASPEELALPSAVALFAIVAATYALTLVYALLLPRIQNPLRLADGQVLVDLLTTTVLVHVTGGAQSAYVFFYPLSTIGGALVRYRRGAAIAGAASVLLFASVSLAGWLRWLPVPVGQRLLPWDLSQIALIRQLVLNAAALGAVTVLAAVLGQQLAHTGERLETQRARTADLAHLNDDIIRCLSSGLVTVDRHGHVLTFNEAAEDILGVPREAALGRALGELAPEMQQILGELDVEGTRRRAEITLARGDGAADPALLRLGVTVSPLTDHRGQPMGRIVNFQDLTELRRMEAHVRRNERLAVIGQMAAGVAHDIRNPLASISGSIELLRNAPQVDKEDRALMEIVLREVDRLNGLVTDLLDYARPRDRVPEHMDLAALLAETVRVFQQDRTHPGLTVKLEPAAEGAVLVHADPAQLRQVVWNLLRNAAEAMAKGGEIAVSSSIVTEEGARCAQLAVADTGVGIAKVDQERIFDPFYTTKTRGSGLGLATVHRIVTEHGGTIGLESALGAGTRIQVRLPLEDDKKRES